MVWNSLGIRNFNLIVRLSSKYFQCFEEKCKIFLMNIRKNAASEIISSTFEQRFMYIVRKGLHCRLHPLSSLLRRHIFSLFLWNHEFFLWYSTSTSLKYLTSIFKILVIYIKEVYKVFYSLLLNCVSVGYLKRKGKIKGCLLVCVPNKGCICWKTATNL